MKFSIDHLTVAAYPKKRCLEFSSGDTDDIHMIDIGRRLIPSRDLSNSQFPYSFSCASDFIDSSETSAYRITSPIPSLDQYVLMQKLLEGSVLAKLGPDKIYFFNLYSNLYSSGLHRF